MKNKLVTHKINLKVPSAKSHELACALGPDQPQVAPWPPPRPPGADGVASGLPAGKPGVRRLQVTAHGVVPPGRVTGALSLGHMAKR